MPARYPRPGRGGPTGESAIGRAFRTVPLPYALNLIPQITHQIMGGVRYRQAQQNMRNQGGGETTNLQIDPYDPGNPLNTDPDASPVIDNPETWQPSSGSEGQGPYWPPTTTTTEGSAPNPPWYAPGHQLSSGIQSAINRGDYQSAYGQSPQSAASARLMGLIASQGNTNFERSRRPQNDEGRSIFHFGAAGRGTGGMYDPEQGVISPELSSALNQRAARAATGNPRFGGR